MAKDYAKEFYNSKKWHEVRNRYAKRVGVCERCLAKGRYVPGEIVHHKVHITPGNINDPSITLNEDNLELVCRDCHAELHGARERRYKIDDFGHVTCK